MTSPSDDRPGSSEDPTLPLPADQRERELAAVARRQFEAAAPHQPTLRGEIAGHRILGLLGRGGMGEVYRAEQAGTKQIIAIKVLRPGLLSERMVQRFRNEARYLGRLKHPGIARVYAADVAQTDGETVPYLAMELVEGARSIVHDANERRLDSGSRLDLIARVADAVQHAHQHSIIHRDLKPANILVDGTGQPKVVDFGIARATDSDIQITTLDSEVGRLIGTLPYMSPEQAAGDPRDVDTRSDIYSLGVVAFELLVGRLPHRLEDRPLEDVLRTIREAAPPRMSSLDRSLRGDVETIVAKAMEKDRTRRYQSASALAEDIRRHLHDEPIVARPASVSYQVYKFAKRHKSLVAGVAAILLVLVAGVVGTGTALVGEARQRRHAESQAAIAEAINDFLNRDLLAAVAPSVEAGQGRDVLMREVLDEASRRTADAARPGGRFADKPLVLAGIRSTLGETYRLLGELGAAEPHLSRALEIRTRILSEEHPETLDSMNYLALLYAAQARWKEAESLSLRTLDLGRRVLGPEHSETLGYMNNLAMLYGDRGRYEEAESLYLQTLERCKRVLGKEHPDTLRPMNNLANLYDLQARHDEAERLLLEVMEIRTRTLGEEHRETLSSMHSLANVYVSQARHDDAEPLLLRAMEIKKRVLGEEHPETLESMHDLATLYDHQGRYAAAEALLLETMGIEMSVLGEEHPTTLGTMGNLAIHHQIVGHDDECERLYLRTLELKTRVLGEEHPDTLKTVNNIAVLYSQQGRHQEAERYLLQTMETMTNNLGAEHTSTLASMQNLGDCYVSQGRYDEAQPLLLRALEAQTRTLGEQHRDTLSTMNSLATLYEGLERYEEAEPHYRRALEIARRVLGDESQHTLVIMYNLAELLRRTGDLDEALPLFEEAVRTGRTALPEGHLYMLGLFLLGHGRTLSELERLGDAEPLLLEAHEILLATDPSGEYVPECAKTLADLYERSGKPARPRQSQD